MKIEFSDHSFLEILPKDNQQIDIILCGYKNEDELTMSFSRLNRGQVEEIIKFLSNWKNSI